MSDIPTHGFAGASRRTSLELPGRRVEVAGAPEVPMEGLGWTVTRFNNFRSTTDQDHVDEDALLHPDRRVAYPESFNSDMAAFTTPNGTERAHAKAVPA